MHLLELSISDCILPVPDCILPIPNVVVNLFDTGVEEVFFNQGNVEAFMTFEGIKPLMLDTAHVKQQSEVAILLFFPLVSF